MLQIDIMKQKKKLRIKQKKLEKEYYNLLRQKRIFMDILQEYESNYSFNHKLTMRYKKYLDKIIFNIDINIKKRNALKEEQIFLDTI